MRIQPYATEQLKLTGCYRVNLRWKTHRRKSSDKLSTLDAGLLTKLLDSDDIKVLELTCTNLEIGLLVSLAPRDCVSAVVNRIKGRISKWLQPAAEADSKQRLLARGYFVTTVDNPDSTELENYLSRPSERDGDGDRTSSPVHRANYSGTGRERRVLNADHTVSRMRLHIVMSTWARQAVFTTQSAELISDYWRKHLESIRVMPDKVSWFSDHVHIVVSIHPSVIPADVVPALINSAQEIMWREFEADVVSGGADQLWQPTAYIGSIGDLTSAALNASLEQ